MESKNISIIILMARWHAFRRCKKRLSRVVGSLQAAKIQKQLTVHTTSVASELAKHEDVEIHIAISGIGSNAGKRWARSQGIQNVTIQSSGNLGCRMKKEIIKAHSNRRGPLKVGATILIGTDLPTLSKIDLLEAINVLKKKDMVIGPSEDGGYWLIGFSKKLINPLFSWPFNGINWGSNQVLNETIHIATTKEVDYQLLRSQNDIDTIEDLEPWQNLKKIKPYQLLYQQ